jgi:DNA-binding IclR family transcriptional regulator
MEPTDDLRGAARGAAVLRLLASQPAPMSATTVARHLGIPRASTYRILDALATEGFVQHYPEAQRWGLGIVAFEIGNAYLRQAPLERLARPLLVDLVNRVHETTHFGVLHGADVMYVVKEQPVRSVPTVIDVGVRLPAHLTASGRAILAELPPAQIRALFPTAAAFTQRTDRGPASLPELRTMLRNERAQGWASEDGMISAGLASIAHAVTDHEGRPVGSVAVTFPVERWPIQDRPRLAGAVVTTARRLTQRLQLRPHA